MSTYEVRALIEEQAQALGLTLHAGMATSLAAARKRSAGLQHNRYPHLLPLILRVEFREYLELEGLPQGWEVGGDPRLMGQLLLRHPELGMEMRFIKERRGTYPGGVPIAGRNAKRRRVWTQEPLGEILRQDPSMQDPYNLLLCWDFAGEVPQDEFGLRIVHTIGPGTYGSSVPCDLILDVRAGGDIFSRLKFEGSDDHEDFFSIDISKEENGS